MPSQLQVGQTPLPVGTSIAPGSLRAEMEARRAARGRFEVKEAISIIVPLCMQLGELHARGRTLFVHPSCIRYGRDGAVAILDDRAHTMPGLPRDRACLAPEERRGAEGDARSSVFAVGAILYELLTSAAIGPGMRRPSEVVPDLPTTLEAVLGKALVADAKHRPADLAALAAALHHIAPGASIAPPAANVSHLDHDDDFEVDIRLSMIPPSEMGPAVILPRPPAMPAFAGPPALPKLQSIQGEGPYTVAIPEPDPGRRSTDPTQRLSDLKSRLEADPRPRYVVIKDGMDHGPFSAVELLQQIASGSFAGENVLRDSFSGEERFIKDWEEFAPFSEQAKLNRDIKQEKRALEAVVVAEKKGTQYKALIGAAVLGVFAAGGAGWWYRERTNKERELEVHAERSTAIDVDGGLGSGKVAGVPGGGGLAGGPRPGGGGNYPVVAGGGSCEAAQAKYSEEYKIGGDNGPPDLTAGAYGAVLNRGSYLSSCGVPSSMAVNICVAVQNGRAVGVTVSTTPSSPGIASCVAGQVRSLPFPSNPRLDVTRTTFSAN